MASQAGSFNVQELADAGVPLVGGRLYTYSFGTTTQKTAYTDAAGTVPHTYTSDGAGGLYIALNARGELPAPLYLASGPYDLALKRADGSTVWTRRADPQATGLDLSNASDLSLGVAMVGGAARVVDSIAALRTLPKTGSTRALVTGYYAAGDGGSGSFYYDAADTTSTDNGGSVIVASDGGRWKLAQSFAVSPKQYGAKADNATDNSAKLQPLFTAGFDGLRIPAGTYRYGTGLVVDHTGTYPTTGTPSTRFSVRGENMANSILAYTGTGYAINLIGTDNTGAGQGIYGIDVLAGLTVQDAALAKSNSGIFVKNKAFWKIEDVFLQYHDTALELQSTFTAKVVNSYFSYSTVGTKLTSSGTLGGINSISFDRCTYTSNSKAGVLGVVTGTCNSWRDCTFESNGTQADVTTGGWVGNLGTGGYSGPITFDNCYFELNKGIADISIDNTTASNLTVIVRGCLFNRASGTGYTTYNINVTNSGGGTTRLLLEGNLFLSLLGYVSDPARPSIKVDARTEVIDLGGNYFNDSVSLQVPFASGTTLSGTVSSAGTIGGAPAFLSAARTATGVYRITTTGLPLGKDATYYEVAALCTDTGGTTFVQRCTKLSSTQFDVATVNSTLTPTDSSFMFVVHKKGG